MTNEYKYRKYLPQTQETRWATPDEVERSGIRLTLGDEDYRTEGRFSAGGVPLASDTETAVVDNTDTHTVIFGATGSKKTRLFCMPLVNILAKAGESFIVTDPKGEVFERTSGLAREKGYKVLVLNFRDLGAGSCWNPLAYPYEVYTERSQGLGISLLNDFVEMLGAEESEKTTDIFWPNMAKKLLVGSLLLLADYGKESEFNLASLCTMTNMSFAPDLKKIAPLMKDTYVASSNLKGVYNTAISGTMESIYGVAYSMVSLFNAQPNLCAMLSRSDFDISDFGREKTAVYILVPDEKTTYHALVTAFVKQAYEILIETAQNTEENRLPVRVNFVLDEFCNIPALPDMASMISAARSRNMRFYLVVQSKHQLKRKYKEDAETIKGNCDNWMFLTSRELELLQELSNLCGTIKTANGRERALISVSELQRLNKERGEVLILHGRNYPFISRLPDIDDYPAFRKRPPVQLTAADLPEVERFSMQQLIEKIKANEIPVPYSEGAFYRKPMF